ncbi:MAG: transposase [bacterium]|nr:transposase [bacterium]
MNQNSKDVSLLLMFITGFMKAGEPGVKTWNGYIFEVLDDLEEEGLIKRYSPSIPLVQLTAKGVVKAHELREKFDIDQLPVMTE